MIKVAQRPEPVFISIDYHPIERLTWFAFKCSPESFRLESGDFLLRRARLQQSRAGAVALRP